MGFSSFALTEPSDKRWGVGGRNDDLNLKVKKNIYIYQLFVLINKI